MKKVVVVVVLIMVIFSGCAKNPKIKHIESKTFTYGFDLSKYAKKGFLFTPNDYGADYVALGMYNIKTQAEGILIEKKISNNGNEFVDRFWMFKDINTSNVVDSAYNFAIKKGANAITSFKITSGFDPMEINGETVKVPYIEISGFLIKRLK